MLDNTHLAVNEISNGIGRWFCHTQGFGIGSERRHDFGAVGKKATFERDTNGLILCGFFLLVQIRFF